MMDLAEQRRFGELVARRVQEARRDLLPRLFAKDATLWVSGERERAEVVDRLGWLDLPATMEARVPEIEAFVAEVRAAGFRRILLLGMGGSSLAPEVFARLSGGGAGGLPLTVLDTTDPGAIQDAAAAGDLATTLFLVSSKSGTTVEPNALLAYFLERTGGAGAQFAAITDPGTALAALAGAKGFRRTFLNPPDIGGRYSALSLFGLVPAALVGVDVRRVLASARRSREECAASDGLPGQRAARLAALLASAAEGGRDKLTFLMPRAAEPFGAWVEQLVAESTGKQGKGVLPVVGEPVRVPAEYGADRVFVALFPPGDGAGPEQPALSALAKAGYPALALPFDPAVELGAAFYEWEIATALLGVWLRINPFDQPNVAESKANTDAVLAGFSRGEGPEPAPGPLDRAALAARLAAWLDALRPGDYMALLAYLAPTPLHDAGLARLRAALGAATHAAVTVGYGPRFLHSTGQLHKGGPATGAFLQIETVDPRDAAVPGAGYTFGRLKLAQALGDVAALERRERNVVRVRLAEAELPVLEAALGDALRRHRT
jgi:transaldolase/glucose-6-phosphate isomerase